MAAIFRTFIRNASGTAREGVKYPFPQINHAEEKGLKIWRNIFIFMCIPSLVITGIASLLEEEKEPPEFKPYDYLRIREKPFPWGDGNKTLFHNPHRNALPDGYEEVA